MATMPPTRSKKPRKSSGPRYFSMKGRTRSPKKKMRPETRKKRMLRQMIEAATNRPKFTLATPAVMVTTLNGIGVNPFATMTTNALST
jgi:hypothetical protein